MQEGQNPEGGSQRRCELAGFEVPAAWNVDHVARFQSQVATQLRIVQHFLQIEGLGVESSVRQTAEECGLRSLSVIPDTAGDRQGLSDGRVAPQIVLARPFDLA